RKAISLLSLASVPHDDGTAEAQPHGGKARGADPGALLLEDGALFASPTRAAIFLRPRRGDPAALKQDSMPSAGEFAFREYTGLTCIQRPQFAGVAFVKKRPDFLPKPGHIRWFGVTHRHDFLLADDRCGRLGARAAQDWLGFLMS